MNVQRLIARKLAQGREAGKEVAPASGIRGRLLAGLEEALREVDLGSSALMIQALLPSIRHWLSTQNEADLREGLTRLREWLDNCLYDTEGSSSQV